MRTMSRRRFLAHATLPALALQPTLRAEQPKVRPTVAVARASNAFNADFFRAVRQDPGNVFFSAFSIESAFAMIALGAKGETLSQLQRGLHLPTEAPLSPSGFRELSGQLNKSPQPAARKGMELSLANALWGRHTYPWNKDYLSALQTHFGAGLIETDFHQPEAARQRINQWVEQETRQKIQELLAPGSITPRTRLVLTNAIYFKGRWEAEFDKKGTVPQPFLNGKGGQSRVPFMHKTGSFSYAETTDWQALELPYIGRETSLVILIPVQLGALNKLQNQIDAAWIDQMLSRLSPAKQVQVAIPKFKLATEYDLKARLEQLGVTDVFSEDRADLSGMHTGTERLCVTTAVHKAFVEVNEEGTEAAAATGIVVGEASAPPMIKTFVADHPFVFLIRHRPTGLILFFGKVENL